MTGGVPARRVAAQTTLQRRLVIAFTERLVLKATAVFLAVVLWFVVNAKEPELELVPVRFIPTLDSSLVLRDPVPQLEAIVAGSPKELIKLTSNAPVIHRQITADSPDTLVLDLRPSDVTLPDGVDAVVRDVQPRSVTLRFEPTWSRKVPVHSAIDIATVSWPGPIATSFEPETVQVSGPRHLVVRVASVRTVKTTITFPDSLPHLVDIDTTGLGPIRVRPSQVKVMLTLLPRPVAR
jgi:YbbR domain-containing protein